MGILEFPYVRLGGLAVLVCLAAGCAARSAPAVVTVAPDRAPRETPEEMPEEPADPPEELPDGVLHRVLPGQTLWRIARTYDVPLENLVAANEIADPSHIDAGDMIWIPGAERSLDVEIVIPQSLPGGGEWTWPVPGGRVLSDYGASRHTHRHGGVDIGAPHGHPIVAARDGHVVYSGAGMRGYGKTVILDHGDGLQSLYAHGSALLVAVGDRVDRGQTIARVGRTGNASADHCHFEIRVNDRRVDPLPWVDGDRRAAR